MEKAIEELAEAQRRTEVEVKELAKGLKETRQMVGGLSDAVGYGLEDRAIKSLPELLQARYGIKVTTPLKRRYLEYNGRYVEVNIYGEGEKDGDIYHIVGEAKARLSKKHIDSFLRLINTLTRQDVFKEENKFLFLITYVAPPDVEDYAKGKGLELIWSYEV